MVIRVVYASGSVTLFFGFTGAFLRFSRKLQDESAPKFFSGFGRKHPYTTRYRALLHRNLE